MAVATCDLVIPWDAQWRHAFRRALNRHVVNDKAYGSRRRPSSRRMRQAQAEHDARQPLAPHLPNERG